MCPHEPEGKCRRINQIITAHVTCVTGPVTINHVSVINCYIVLCMGGSKGQSVLYFS